MDGHTALMQNVGNRSTGDDPQVLNALLMQDGIDVNVKSDTIGYTALMLAIENLDDNSCAKVHALLRHHDIEVNVKNEIDGKTALMMAIKLTADVGDKWDEAIHALLQCDGIDVNARDQVGVCLNA